MSINSHIRGKITEDQWERLINRLVTVNHHIKTRGIRMYGSNDLLTGYAYDEFYDWDLYFENVYLSYFGVSQFCRSNIEKFLEQQLTSGFVARTLINPRWRQHFKPFMAQTVLLGARQTGSLLWLQDKFYLRLKKYLAYWFWNCDHDRNGLAVWDSADASGMDNQVQRAGDLYSETVEGVDLNCYLLRELQAMVLIADELGYAEDAAQYRMHADTLSILIRDTFWDEADGFFYDRNEQTGELIRVKTVCGFLPLWAGVATQQQAKRLIEEHLTNEAEFWTPYPIACMAKSEPGYYQESRAGECNWCGTTWIPTNYMVFHGLIDYGYTALAKKLAYRTFDLVLNEEATREYYNGETGSGQGLNPFWGWSTLGYVMPLEFELGYNPMTIELARFSRLGEEVFELSFPTP